MSVPVPDVVEGRGMYRPGRFPEPDDIRRPPDTGPAHHDSDDRGGLLSNLTLSIGRLMLKGKLEIQRVGAVGSEPAQTQASPVLRNRLSWRPRLGISATWPTPRPGFQDVSHQNQKERVLAERGAGQLVDERGALRIRGRSARMIALETVRALAVRTRDFAAYIRAEQTRTADRPGHSLSAGRPAQHPRLLSGENCTVFLSDVVGFGADTRNDEDRRIIREALFSMTHTVLQSLPDMWSWDDRGDGLLTVVPPSVPTAVVIAHLHKELPAALEEHNRVYPASARIQLRVAIDVGPVASDTMGVSGEAIIVTARLIEAPLLKNAMGEGRTSLGIIASPFIYKSVIRHGPYVEGYSEVRVDVKESSIVAWMNLFDTSLLG